MKKALRLGEDVKDNSLLKILIKEEEIKQRCKELASEIEEYFNGEPVTLVCVLNGAVMFFADLAKNFSEKVEIDYEFIRCSSYDGRESTGVISMQKDIENDIEGKNVVIVEDIIDTGFTLKHIKEILEKRKPKEVVICTLLDKACKRKVNVDVKFVGFEIEDRFIVGYGLDWDQTHRNIPYIAYLE